MINNTIKRYKDEQERIQKKTFTKWVNLYLCQYNASYKINDLYQDIKDGVRLLQLLEVLSREELPREQGRFLQRVHYLSNVKRALDFLEKRGIKLVNINPTDIVDGKPSIILGLIWTIILHFDLETNDIIEATLASADHEELKKYKGSAKQCLLAWTSKNIADKYGIPVKDFTSSWRDGHAFNAMVHNIDPTLINMDTLKANANRTNLENAFTVAEKELGIPRLLDPEDVDVDRPDEKSIMTYLAQFVRVYGADKKPKVVDELDSARKAGEQEKADVETIKQYVKDLESIAGPEDKIVEDLNKEYRKFLELLQEHSTKKELVDTLSRKRKDGALILVKPEDVDEVTDEFLSTEQIIRSYRWRLDSSMPGELGKIGKWLARAEDCLYQPWPVDEDIERLATNLHTRLVTHQEIFKSMDSMRQKYQTLSRTMGERLPKEQIEDVQKRLSKVYQDEPDIYRKLEYLELKHRISVYFIVCERKLKLWTEKYGSKDEVAELLQDYTKFVIDEHLYDSFDKTFEDFRRKAEYHKKRDLAGDEEACRNLDRFVTTSREKWNKLQREIRYAQPMLEEVIKNWRRYHQSCEALREWMPEAERALNISLDDRQSFFADLTSWVDRHKGLNQAGNFLIENSVEPVGVEVKNTLLTINRRWTELMEEVSRTQHLQEVERTRRDYNAGSKHINDWLDRVETLLATRVPCTKANIKTHLKLLHEATEQEEGVKTKFKEMTTLGQALSKDSTAEAVNEIIGNLKFMKERIQKLRKDLKDNTKVTKTLLPNVESLETGIEDLTRWVEEGERLLETHRVENDPPAMEERLLKHQQHFGETTYYKSMLENKEKMYNRVMGMMPPKMDSSELESNWRQLKDRFQVREFARLAAWLTLIICVSLSVCVRAIYVNFDSCEPTLA